MIEINNVSFGYSKKHEVFNQLNLKLNDGKIYGLLGKNGAGKSTLLKLMCGFLLNRNGSIEADKFIPFKREPKFYRTLFYMPEHIEFSNISIIDFINSTSGFYPSFDKSKMSSIIDNFELNSKSRIGELSFGQLKKLFLSFGFAANFKILLLDEPTIGLDISAKAMFRKLLAEEINEDKLIVLSTHQIDDIDSLLDHIIVINNGKIELDASLEVLSKLISFQQTTSINENIEVLFNQKTPLGYSIISKSESTENEVDLPVLYQSILADNTFTQKLNELLTEKQV